MRLKGFRNRRARCWICWSEAARAARRGVSGASRICRGCARGGGGGVGESRRRVGAIAQRRTLRAASVLPDISPTRGEIGGRLAFANLRRCENGGQTRLPISPLRGRCPAGRGGRDGTPAIAADAEIFPFRAARFGNVTVALAPDRGRAADRRADYHDPALPPRHALVAFGLWLRQNARLPRARPCRRARHAGMAAGQDRGAERGLLPRNRHRPPAGHLSLHRQQSRRGRAGQAPHRRRHHRPSAAAARRRRARRGRSRSWSAWSTNTRRPTGSTAAAATGWQS